MKRRMAKENILPKNKKKSEVLYIDRRFPARLHIWFWQNLGWILVIGWGILIYFPSTLLQYSLLDDGYTILKAREFSHLAQIGNWEAWREAFFEPDVGRVRPGYWVLQSLLVYLSGENPYLNHAWRLMILAITCVFIVKILRYCRIGRFWQILSVFLFIHNSQNFENYYRLGPGEPFLGLLLLATVYVIITTELKGWHWWVLAGVFLALAAGVKETFFLTGLCFVAWAGYIHLFNKQKRDVGKRIWWLAVLMIGIGVWGLYIQREFPEANNYADNFAIDAKRLVLNAQNYWAQMVKHQLPVMLMALVGMYTMLMKLVKRESDLELDLGMWLMFMLVAVGNFLLLLPWGFALARYLLIVNLSLVMMFGYGGQNLEDWLRGMGKHLNPSNNYYVIAGKSLILIFILCQFFIQNLVEIANQQLWQKTDVSFANQILEELARLPEKSEIYTNYVKGDANIEIYKATQWHLALIYDRHDISFAYLDEHTLCTSNERYLLDRTSTRFTATDSLIAESEIIASGSATYSPLNEKAVIQSFIQGHKSKDWSSSHPFDWYLMTQRPGTCITLQTL